MSKLAQIVLAGLICCFAQLSCQGAYADRTAGKDLAVTVSGFDCAVRGSQRSRQSRIHAPAAEKHPATALTCALHACATPSKEAVCQLHSIPQLAFAPCEQGAVLISTRYILQHLQQAASQDSQQHTAGSDKLEAAADSILPDGSPNLSASDPTAASSSQASAVSLQLAAACTAAAPAAANKVPLVLWSKTFNLTLSPEESMHLTQAMSHSSQQPGSGSQHGQPSIDGQSAVDTLGAASVTPLRHGWTAGNLDQQLVLVELLLPAPPQVIEDSESNLLSASEQLQNSTADEETEQHEGADSLDLQQAGVCSAGWSVWLARAGMVIFVAGLQLLPLSSLLQR